MDTLIFQEAPTVELGSNVFIDCLTILQFDNTPLIEVIREKDAGFSTRIPIYHQDGTDLARVIGSRLILTESGKRANVRLLHKKGTTVCTLGTQILFEITRRGAAALKASAELYTPSGFFVKYAGISPSLVNATGDAISIGGLFMTENTIQGCKIGVLITSNGLVSIGYNGTTPIV